jgi:hypothetical protein
LYCGVRAVAHEGGVIVTTEFVVDSLSQMWAEVNRVMQNREIQLRINPTLHPHTPPDFVRRTQIVGYKELKAATPICRGMILEDKLRHTGEIALSEHVTQSGTSQGGRRRTAQFTEVTRSDHPCPLHGVRSC